MLPYFHYRGIPTQQNPHALNVFKRFFAETPIEYVIEIGTANGGLSTFLYEQSILHEFQFVTYDIRPTMPAVPMNNRVANALHEPTRSEIISILRNHTCLLLCDGGDKATEFLTYAPHLCHGSFIMAHDYAPDVEYHRTKMAGEIWDWCEITDEMIGYRDNGDVAKDPYWYHAFLDVAWLCCRKTDAVVHAVNASEPVRVLHARLSHPAHLPIPDYAV